MSKENYNDIAKYLETAKENTQKAFNLIKTMDFGLGYENTQTRVLSYEMEHLINDIEHCKIISEELVGNYENYGRYYYETYGKC